MLIELGVVEQRHRAVLEVADGLSVSEVARRYGVTRQTVHRWLRRYAVCGLAGLTDGSSRPLSCPHQTPPAVETRIVELREEHEAWGPRTIAHRLAREGVARLPSRSAVYRCLVREGLIEPQKRRRRRSDYRRWERSRPMELWQMDVMGGVLLADGRELKVVTGIDDHSRFFSLRPPHPARHGAPRLRSPRGRPRALRRPRRALDRQRQGLHRAFRPGHRRGALRPPLA